MRGTGFKDLLGHMRGLFGRAGCELPHNDVEFRPPCCEGLESRIFAQSVVEFERGFASLGKALGKFATGNGRQKLMRGPQSDCGCSGA